MAGRGMAVPIASRGEGLHPIAQGARLARAKISTIRCSNIRASSDRPLTSVALASRTCEPNDSNAQEDCRPASS
ncbi:hypothetical protein GGTG_13509 [Gaeumannomyces tritici R3-111a-1]|uniref:Uncharacterized protein n=1 Tax=Gaeumannomyces tritici (strain R3-111a-1) TaxID=644352 RepID=J3PJ26_GAET3|nr:hypothetical protein GGTG_13509 [Gaeumannomyces tritici R3-111a-1]EJT68917.1 hypothetical protein GGTG_13509 [Gaeumannomyces tritici R3-111a-1]